MIKRTIVRVLLPLLCLCLLLTACGKTVKLDYDALSGSYHDPKNNVTYLRAEDYYEAVGLREDLEYARIPSKKMDDMILYQIEGADPTLMLANQYFELFYAKGTALPTLVEMDVTQVYVGSVISGAVMDLTVATITDSDDIDALVAGYQSGVCFPETEKFEDGTIVSEFNLRFASANYPAFYYRLAYHHYAKDVLVYEVIESRENFVPTYAGVEVTIDDSYVDKYGEIYAIYNFGSNILYDQVTGYCYPVGDTIAKHMTQN